MNHRRISWSKTGILDDELHASFRVFHQLPHALGKYDHRLILRFQYRIVAWVFYSRPGHSVQNKYDGILRTKEYATSAISVFIEGYLGKTFQISRCNSPN